MITNVSQDAEVVQEEIFGPVLAIQTFRTPEEAIEKAIRKPGFSFVEIIAPCPTLFGRRNRLGDGARMMQVLKERSVVKEGCSTQEVSLDYDGDIVVGEFIDRDTPTLRENYETQMKRVLGENFVPFAGVR